MRKLIWTIITGAVLTCCAFTVRAEVNDYSTVTAIAQKDDRILQIFETEDGSGTAVKVAAVQDTLYVTAKNAGIYAKPGESSTKIAEVTLGDVVERSAVCDNGWSKVSGMTGEQKVIGYIQNLMLSDCCQIQSVDREVEIKTDTSVLDYPGRKDGEIIGEVLESDLVRQTGTVNDVWSLITYTDMDGAEQKGYIPSSCLVFDENEETGSDEIDTELDAGTLHESSGNGVFAEALEEEETSVSEEDGVQIGTPVAASSDSNLKNLGVFKITHYCPCSICCGPYANGITSTGVTAVTNHTIAVDPTQIPYGSQVVINGQVYVAEDCGGAIKRNCIDIYVATHTEGENKGVYYTEVYLIE